MAASAAASKAKRLMKLTLALFGRSFESGKCKTAAKMSVARIKLLRNKRQAVVKQMRRDIALLLQSGQDATARIRVEHVIREQNILAANEFIELFCELIVARLQIIAKQRECPADLKEGIASLKFAAPRCSEIPELATIRDVFEKKYGRDFVSAAVDLRPNAGVNRMLIEKLSVKTPSGETKLKVMKEIAKEYQIEWDNTESEIELLKPPEEKLEGPSTFVSASSLPVKPAGVLPADSIKQTTRLSDSQETESPIFHDTASAAEAAAESAKLAILANSSKSPEPQRFNRRHSYNVPVQKPENSDSYEGSESKGSDDLLSRLRDPNMCNRRHSDNAPSVKSGIKFDRPNFDDEIEIGRLPSPVPSSHSKHAHAPRVHPKLLDYDDSAARFEALWYRK